MPAITQRLIRRGEVETLTGLKRATLYQLMSRGEFPRPVPLTGVRAVAWVESDVAKWVSDRINSRKVAA